MVLAGSKAKRLSSVNHPTKAIHLQFINSQIEWLKGFKKILEQKENEKNHRHHQKVTRKYFGKYAKHLRLVVG